MIYLLLQFLFIEINLAETDVKGVNWIHLAQERV
jgi:hypothetical protein